MLVAFKLSDFTKLLKNFLSISVQDKHLNDIYVSITTQAGLLTRVLNAAFLIALGGGFCRALGTAGVSS